MGNYLVSRVMTAAAACVVLPPIAHAQDAPPPAPTQAQISYSPYTEEDFPNQVFFGDTHLHTAFFPLMLGLPERRQRPTTPTASPRARK